MLQRILGFSTFPLPLLGQQFTLDWSGIKQVPSGNQIADGKVDFLQFFNQTGVGFACTQNPSGQNFYIPDGAWGVIPASSTLSTDTSMTLTTDYVIPNSPINAFLAFYGTPGDQPLPMQKGSGLTSPSSVPPMFSNIAGASPSGEVMTGVGGFTNTSIGVIQLITGANANSAQVSTRVYHAGSPATNIVVFLYALETTMERNGTTVGAEYQTVQFFLGVIDTTNAIIGTPVLIYQGFFGAINTESMAEAKFFPSFGVPFTLTINSGIVNNPPAIALMMQTLAPNALNRMSFNIVWGWSPVTSNLGITY